MSDPIKANLRTEIIPISLLVLAGASSLYFYQHFPSRVPIHWNFAGQVDGWGTPAFAAFFLPIFFLVMYLLLLFVPRFDPKRERYQDFDKIYHIFKNLLVGFMVVVYFLTSINGIGYALPIGEIIPVMIGVLFIFIGNYMGKLKLNWFIGARTPWTMSSENVWNKTNRLAGKLFIVAGILMMAEIITPLPWKLPLLVLIIAAITIVPMVYSYILFAKEQKDNNKII